MNLNWINMFKMQYFKIIFYNLLIFFILYIAVTYYFYNKLDQNVKVVNRTYNSNNIRASYPTYSNLDKQTAIKIFDEYAAPKSSYEPFIAYRRQMYNGTVVNIDNNGFRKSTNHSLNDSTWFFGGSTMWGTGATDETTIPSFFAKYTGEKVLNLGESGYTSFQEFINLQLMLLRGYKPKRVFFYDGQNDGYRYCQKNESVPSHAYYSRYLQMINSYPRMKKQLNNMSQNKNRMLQETSFFKYVDIKMNGLFSKIAGFMYSPFSYFFKNQNPSRAYKSLSFNSDKSFKDFSKENDYLICSKEENARRAAKVTVFSWLNAYKLLKDEGISVRFILQPTAVYNPSRYQLDYIINETKQRIVDEADNYTVYYDVLRDEWNKQCSAYGICDSLIDLSGAFFDNKNPIFVDACHVAPIGNEIIAKKLIKYIKE